MINDNGRKLLNDEEIEKVAGGMDAKAFAMAIYDKTSDLGPDSKYRPILEAIKKKDYLEVYSLALPMLYDGDPIIMEAYNKSK